MFLRGHNRSSSYSSSSPRHRRQSPSKASSPLIIIIKSVTLKILLAFNTEIRHIAEKLATVANLLRPVPTKKHQFRLIPV